MKNVIQNVVIIFLASCVFSAMGYLGYGFFFQKHTNKTEILQKLQELKPVCLECLPAMKKNNKKLMIIVRDLGLDEETTEKAINDLPPEVTLSFSCYSPYIRHWIGFAKAAGHLVFLQIKSEEDAMDNNLLPYFDGVLLMSELLPVEDIDKLETFVEYAGEHVNYIVDGRLQKEQKLDMVANVLKRTITHVDYSLSVDEILNSNLQLEQIKGVVVVDAMLVPYLIDQIKKEKCQLSSLSINSSLTETKEKS